MGDVPPGADGGIGAVREMLGSKPRPVGWAQRRARIDEVGSAWPIATDIRLTSVDVDGLTGEWSLAPDADDGSALLFFHGGGYASGSILSHRSMVTEAGRAAGIRTLAVEYRRSPEHPFPTAVDDAVRAWEWLRASGLDADRIVLGGDSAGGGLVLAVWQRLRDAGEPGPAALWLVSPWTDLTLSGESLDLKDAVDPLLHRAYLAELAAAYVPDASGRADPLVSPLFADLAGLPPTLIQVGTDETLLDDAVRLARAAGLAGAAVTLQTYPLMIHAFPLWNAVLSEGRRALSEFGAFARSRLGGPVGG
ncbi:MAG: alpha/beta hydrolase [Microbacterium sp.]